MGDGLEDLAATYSPVAWATVPWALGVFTAEFGMGSGAGPPPWPPGHRAHPFAVVWVMGFRCAAAMRCAEGGPLITGH